MTIDWRSTGQKALFWNVAHFWTQGWAVTMQFWLRTNLMIWCKTIIQTWYTPFMLAYIPAPWILWVCFLMTTPISRFSRQLAALRQRFSEPERAAGGAKYFATTFCSSPWSWANQSRPRPCCTSTGRGCAGTSFCGSKGRQGGWSEGQRKGEGNLGGFSAVLFFGESVKGW